MYLVRFIKIIRRHVVKPEKTVQFVKLVAYPDFFFFWWLGHRIYMKYISYILWLRSEELMKFVPPKDTT